MTDDALTQEQTREFVAVSHGDFGRVKTLLAEEPRFLNARYEEWNETGLEAASHMGNREIAEYLLAQGAPMAICTAAMLGQTDRVGAFLASDPTLANSAGAHGISVLYHAAMSGNTEVAELLVAHGNEQDPGQPLIGATLFGRLEMVKWLLARGASVQVRDWQGKTALQLALEQNNQAVAAILRQHGATE
jgi:ankyrin repeat protein